MCLKLKDKNTKYIICILYFQTHKKLTSLLAFLLFVCVCVCMYSMAPNFQAAKFSRIALEQKKLCFANI